MSELPWLEEYSGQTTDELIALEGKYGTASLIVAFHQAVQQKWGRVGEAGWSEAERIIDVIEALEREVNNGGYDQFFVNSSNEYAPIIVDALNCIGCTETAKITQQAIDHLGIAGPLSVEAIDRVMEEKNEERSENLNECDQRYFKGVEDIEGSLFEFIKSNRDTIILTE